MSSGVEMVSGRGSSLLEGADTPGEDQVWLGGEHGVMSNLNSLKTELVTADKFAGKSSLLLPRN